MLVDNDPPLTRFISIPREMSSLSCSAITAGIVEAVLDGLGFVSYFNYEMTMNMTLENTFLLAC